MLRMTLTCILLNIMILYIYRFADLEKEYTINYMKCILLLYPKANLPFL